MILGYEKPVEIAPMSVYDNDTFRLYAAAIKDDYDKAVEDLRQMLKNYGDFITTLPGAQQAFYNATLGPVEQMYDKYGGDLLRDPSLRALLRQYAMTAAAKAAPIKQAAAVYDAYKKLYDQLTPEQKAYEDHMLGAQLLKQEWDPYRPWNKTAPDKYVSPTEYFAPTLGKLEKNSYLKGDYWWYGVPEDVVKGQMNNLWEPYAGTNQYKYDRDRIARQIKSANPEMSDKDANKYAEDALKQSIIRQYAGEKMDKMDPQAEYRQKVQLEGIKLGRQKALIKYKHELEHGDENDINNSAFNYVKKQVGSSIVGVYGKGRGKDILVDLYKGDPRSLKASLIQTLRYYNTRLVDKNNKVIKGAGNVFNQALSLAGRESNDGFYARMGQTDAAIKPNELTQKSQNGGILVDGTSGHSGKLRTIRDISTLVAGSRRIRDNVKYNGAVTNNVRNKFAKASGYNPNEAHITKIVPVGGDKNYIAAMLNDGSFHEYREVDVYYKPNSTTKEEAVAHRLWYDYGEVDINSVSNDIITNNLRKRVGGTGKGKESTYAEPLDLGNED